MQKKREAARYYTEDRRQNMSTYRNIVSRAKEALNTANRIAKERFIKRVSG
jgi:hypothetical protein